MESIRRLTVLADLSWNTDCLRGLLFASTLPTSSSQYPGPTVGFHAVSTLPFPSLEIVCSRRSHHVQRGSAAVSSHA